MAPIAERLGPRALKGLVINLPVLLGWATAFGMVAVAVAIVRSLFQVAESGVGWIPGRLGKWIKGKVSNLEQKIVGGMGEAAGWLEMKVADSFHDLAIAVRNVGHEIYGLAEFGYEVCWYLVKYLKAATIGPRLSDMQWKGIHATKVNKIQTHDINVLRRRQAAAGAGAIGAATMKALKGIRGELHGWEHWTLPRVKTTQHAVGHAIPQDIAGLRARDSVLERLYGRLAKVTWRDHAKWGTLAFAGILTLALGKLGAGWFRCTNVRKLGRGVCRMNTGLLDDLLLGTLFVVGTISITEFAKELQDEMSVAVKGITGLVRE